MARLLQELKLTTGQNNEEYNFSLSENYNEAFTIRQEVDNSDAFIDLLNIKDSIDTSALRNVKAMVIRNEGKTAAEILIKTSGYKNSSNTDIANSVDIDSSGGNTVFRYTSFLLAAGEYIFLPNSRWASYSEAASGANAKPATSGEWLTIDTDEYSDSTANIDSATSAGVVGHISNTRVYLEPGTMPEP